MTDEKDARGVDLRRLATALALLVAIYAVSRLILLPVTAIAWYIGGDPYLFSFFNWVIGEHSTWTVYGYVSTFCHPLLFFDEGAFWSPFTLFRGPALLPLFAGLLGSYLLASSTILGIKRLLTGRWSV